MVSKKNSYKKKKADGYEYTGEKTGKKSTKDPSREFWEQTAKFLPKGVTCRGHWVGNPCACGKSKKS